ncbi:MAG: hypothetical protein HY787_09995 [Deltaproteobacteria bacterium]|nr:hypothetical protein [Deltaproteobacteria bacterium]
MAEEKFTTGGLKWIFKDLLESLSKADIASSAGNLDLVLNEAGEAEVPCLGRAILTATSTSS